MKLKVFLRRINKMVDKDKSLLDKTVIFSIDDEGNAFKEIYFTPTIGNFSKEDREFDSESRNINAICIN